ncbi:MAG: hypothetical protein DMG60_14330 [Acidobacteria bacterium]|nr:MAG: hypothetical protein DMG60_14330 [Acidobacteriota bacterium]
MKEIPIEHLGPESFSEVAPHISPSPQVCQQIAASRASAIKSSPKAQIPWLRYLHSSSSRKPESRAGGAEPWISPIAEALGWY